MAPRPLLVVVAALVVLATGCSWSFSFGGLDTGDLEAQIETELDDQLRPEGIDITEVTCPGDIEPRTGDVFTCRARADDGSTAVVTVTQIDDQGQVTWEVTDVTG